MDEGFIFGVILGATVATLACQKGVREGFKELFYSIIGKK